VSAGSWRPAWTAAATKETAQLRERLVFLPRLAPDGWPDTGDDALLDQLEEWLAPFLTDARSLDHLKRLDLEQVLLTWVGWDRRPEDPLKAEATGRTRPP